MGALEALKLLKQKQIFLERKKSQKVIWPTVVIVLLTNDNNSDYWIDWTNRL